MRDSMKTETKKEPTKEVANAFDSVAKEQIDNTQLPIVSKEELQYKKFYLISYADRTTDYGTTAFVSISNTPNGKPNAVFIASKVINEDVRKLNMPYAKPLTIIKIEGKNKREYYKLAEVK